MNWIVTEDGTLVNLDKIECISIDELGPDTPTHEVFARKNDEEGYTLASGTLQECRAVMYNLSNHVGVMIIEKQISDKEPARG